MRYNNDVWIHKSNKHKFYDYLFVHIDDFIIVNKDSNAIMKCITEHYMVKSMGLPEYYLGNNYKKDRKGRLCVGSKKCIKEALTMVDNIFGVIRKYDHPLETGDHPELDETPVLSNDKHQKY